MRQIPQPVRVGNYGPYATYVFDAPDTGEVGDAAADESNERSPHMGEDRPEQGAESADRAV